MINLKNIKIINFHRFNTLLSFVFGKQHTVPAGAQFDLSTAKIRHNYIGDTPHPLVPAPSYTKCTVQDYQPRFVESSRMSMLLSQRSKACTDSRTTVTTEPHPVPLRVSSISKGGCKRLLPASAIVIRDDVITYYLLS